MWGVPLKYVNIRLLRKSIFTILQKSQEAQNEELF
jgi:hypothetical protein